MRSFGASLLAALCLVGAAAAENITLQPGDALAVGIARFPELNRTSMIGPDGAVRVGSGTVVSVAGLTLDQAHGAVAAALAKALGVDAGSVLVDVAEYRPVIVHGDGRRGSEVPFRPGLTVVQAAAASDSNRADPGASLIEALEAQRTFGRLADETDREGRALALHARLLAERDGTPIAPVDLVALGISPNRQAEILGAEQRLYDLRTAQFAKQHENLNTQRDAVMRRVDSLSQELALHRKREDLAKQYLATIEDMGDRGLTTENQLRDARTDLVSAQLLVIRIISDQSEAEGDLAGLQAAISDLDMARTMEIAQLIAQSDTELELARSSVNSARRDAGLAESRGDGVVPGRDETYVIHRVSGTGDTAVPATAATPLLPGDVLWVGYR
ncbi:MAG: polysaccharide biosynthesis/export family protein [Amaricoccus sp.]